MAACSSMSLGMWKGNRVTVHIPQTGLLQVKCTSLQHFLRGRMSLLLYPWLPYLPFIKCDTVSIQSALTCYELEVYQLLVSGTSLKWCDIIILWCPLLVLWSGLQTISHDLLVRNVNTQHLPGDSFETGSAAHQVSWSYKISLIDEMR
jgi:hypothetical protein